MAHSINLGACWVNFGKMEVSDQNMEEVISIFNIPKDFKIVSIIPIGNLPNSISRAPGRKKTEDLLHIEKFRKGT